MGVLHHIYESTAKTAEHQIQCNSFIYFYMSINIIYRTVQEYPRKIINIYLQTIKTVRFHFLCCIFCLIVKLPKINEQQKRLYTKSLV